MANTTGFANAVGWTTIFTATDFNSLASGSSVFSAAITSTNDPYGELSLKLKMGGTTVAGDRFDIYLLPLLQNGTIYGDNSAAGATPPVGTYFVGSVLVPSGITSGNFVYGRSNPFLLRQAISADSYKLVVVNKTSVALNAAAAAETYYTFFKENLNV